MKVLFVCTGNTCRSPMAEYYLKSKKVPDLAVSSRGIFASGSTANEKSISVMNDIGIDLKEHISKQLTADDLKADKIFCMTDDQRFALIMNGADENRVFTLGGGIKDPYGASLEIYKTCRDEIISAIDTLLDSGELSYITVDTLRPFEAEKIAELEKICFSEPWSKNAILESLDTGTVFFTAKKNNAVLGYVGIKAVLDEGYITNVAVFPEFRQQNAASLLLAQIDSFAKDKGLSFVSVEVRESNCAAISLYEKFNYKKEGLRKNFYKNPSENAIIMTKRYENL